MGLPVFVGSAFVAQYPTGGGNFWVPLQYLLGLRALGVEAHWLELLWAGGDRRRAQFVGAFRGAVERLGVAEWVTLVCFPESSRDGPPGQAEHHGLAPAELRARARDALLTQMIAAEEEIDEHKPAEDLLALPGMDESRAGELIMAARAPMLARMEQGAA